MFKDYKLELITPEFNSNLMSLILDLEHLRKNSLTDINNIYFEQIKGLFHILESVYSARIEGNRTTINDFIAGKIANKTNSEDNLKEIQSIENAIKFINDNKDAPINRIFISELHKITTNNLEKEGSETPGEYRKINVTITKSTHTPPESILVHEYMQELIDFINRDDPPQYDLIKIALVHHRFVWIHPFDNGNGRTSRLLTYTMLLKYGFNINNLVNISAIFCLNRENYFKYLDLADSGKKENLIQWCEYVLTGLKEEMEKIYKLSDAKYFSTILSVVFERLFELGVINREETNALCCIVKNKILFNLSNSLLQDRLKITSRHATYLLSILKKKNLIIPTDKKEYILNLQDLEVSKNLIYVLKKDGLIPFKE